MPIRARPTLHTQTGLLLPQELTHGRLPSGAGRDSPAPTSQTRRPLRNRPSSAVNLSKAPDERKRNQTVLVDLFSRSSPVLGVYR